MKVQFTIPGDPVPKARARKSPAGFVYKDKKTERFENLVRLAYSQAYPDRIPSEAPISLSIISGFSVPESWSKKKKILAICERIFKISRPDLDNLIKSVSDGLNGVAWKDDRQIYELYARKVYAEAPKTTVSIEFIEEDC